MSYVPSTLDERKAMLESIGKKNINDLFDIVSNDIKLTQNLNLPAAKSEMEVLKIMEDIASKNTIFKTIFRGAGAYKHYIPSVVSSLSSREEFVTAYTPYQAEISQGILQAIFEYQSMICELTGMDASNASVYDGASAAAEAVLMCKDRKKNRILVSEAINPGVLETIKTYVEVQGMIVETISCVDGVMDIESLKSAAKDDVCCVYSEMPNYYGMIADVSAYSEIAHLSGAKYVLGVNPIALAILKSPLECDVDIVVGEGQPLGMPLSFGGPYLGFMACKKDMMRKLPGRIVGETVDRNDKRAYVLTLQAREQHIRREKASSSICSNQALCALTANVYLSAMGPKGLADVATQCMSKAHYMANEISKIDGFNLKSNGEFFHEFVTSIPNGINIDNLMQKLIDNGILGGLPLDGNMENSILWCATEVNTKDEIDMLVEILKKEAR